MLDDTARRRVAQLLAMASSNFDGEVATALRLADRLVRAGGSNWAELFDSARPDRGAATGKHRVAPAAEPGEGPGPGQPSAASAVDPRACRKRAYPAVQPRS